jgi:hypothetical protein
MTSSAKAIVGTELAFIYPSPLAAGSSWELLTVKAELEAADNANYDAWQICQGHDLAKLFVIAVKKYWGIGKITAEEIERAMRLAYESAYFWKTDLGREIVHRFKKMGVLASGLA